jgi:hypothetical protein
MTQLESDVSFLLVKALMTMKEKLQQVCSIISVIAGRCPHNTRSSGRGRQPLRSYRNIWVRSLGDKSWQSGICHKMIPCESHAHSQKNFTEEIFAIYTGTEIFVDSISFAIKSARSPVHRNDMASPQYKLWE